MTIQGHPRSLISAPIESAYLYAFLLDLNSDLGPVLPRFRDISTPKAAFSIPLPYSVEKISGVPLGVGP